ISSARRSALREDEAEGGDRRQGDREAAAQAQKGPGLAFDDAGLEEGAGDEEGQGNAAGGASEDQEREIRHTSFSSSRASGVMAPGSAPGGAVPGQPVESGPAEKRASRGDGGWRYLASTRLLKSPFGDSSGVPASGG